MRLLGRSGSDSASGERDRDSTADFIGERGGIRTDSTSLPNRPAGVTQQSVAPAAGTHLSARDDEKRAQMDSAARNDDYFGGSLVRSGPPAAAEQQHAAQNDRADAGPTGMLTVSFSLTDNSTGPILVS